MLATLDTDPTLGAITRADGGTRFRVWAPARDWVEVVLEAGEVGSAARCVRLERQAGGYHSVTVPEARAGMRYSYRLSGGERLYPDPASRYQPEGPHGPSMIVDPHEYAWEDHGWAGPDPNAQVLYEMHIGTFTKEGTWASAMRELPALAALGVTAIELMPVAEFDGHFGWGYDGVELFAPTRLYGASDDFRRFVDRAHNLGLSVVLDVVYNHLGPSGNYLREFSRDYFSDKYDNEWGDPLNFDGPNAGPVREFFLENAAYWVRDFHLDGLRLDATQQIFDASPVHIVTELTERVRQAAGNRRTLMVAENEPQDIRLVRGRHQGGYGLDAIWNDDFHHSACVALTGRNEAYYTDYFGTPQELVSSAKYGFLYQGQRYKWQGKRRGTPAFGTSPRRFVTYIENHDQIANSGAGTRLHNLSSPGLYRAVTALLLLGPGTPMLFQGQEFAASTPFLYFADHEPELAEAVRRGRAAFLKQFRSLAAADGAQRIADPADPDTFLRCKLDHGEREAHAEAYALHSDLLRLRASDPVFRERRSGALDGAVLSAEALVLRYFGDEAGDRLLFVNLGRDLHLDPAPEPLLAPPPEGGWGLRWSSEQARYGGAGASEVETDQGWIIPGQAAVVLTPKVPDDSGGGASAER